MLSPERKSDAATTMLGITAAAIATACCAGLPAIGVLLGGLTIGVVLGLGFGALILGALARTASAMITPPAPACPTMTEGSAAVRIEILARRQAAVRYTEGTIGPT
jgi:hypothetical protein